MIQDCGYPYSKFTQNTNSAKVAFHHPFTFSGAAVGQKAGTILDKSAAFHRDNTLTANARVGRKPQAQDEHANSTETCSRHFLTEVLVFHDSVFIFIFDDKLNPLSIKKDTSVHIFLERRSALLLLLC